MNGFFSPEAMAALQQAYEMQLTPEEQDIDQVTGLPTNQVSNTSPWHGTVELWKYPNGVNPTKPGEIHYIPRNQDDEDEDLDLDEILNELEEEEIDSYLEEDDLVDGPMTEEEVDALIEELIGSDED